MREKKKRNRKGRIEAEKRGEREEEYEKRRTEKEDGEEDLLERNIYTLV